MENSRPKGLDTIRLVIAYILAILGSVVLGILLWVILFAWIGASDGEDGATIALIFTIIVIIPATLIALVYPIFGFIHVKKCKKNKDIPLIDRKTSIPLTILKMLVSLVLLYGSIPLLIYFLCDLIEAIKRNSLLKQGVGSNQIKFKTESQIEQSTDPLANPDSKHFCIYCGNEITSRYAKFCEHCGKEIEFRR